MIQCPECREMLPEDSAFCDKCGKELKWCPKCRRPKRGMECPVCGNEYQAQPKTVINRARIGCKNCTTTVGRRWKENPRR